MRSIASVGALAAAVVLAAAVGAEAALPTVKTGPATSVTQTSATLNGTVNPNGEPTTYYFQYGTTTAYGAQTPAQGPTASAKQNLPVSARVAGLSPATTYHYRLVATNASGTRFGGDHRLTTPTSVTLGARPHPVVFGAPTSLAGVVSGQGGVRVTLQENPYPFQGFKAMATTTTDSAGRFAFSRTPTANTLYRVVAATRPRAMSAPLLVRVRIALSLRTRRRGRSVVFSGVALPAHNGRTVRVQRRVSGRWRTVKRGRLGGTANPLVSRYRVRVRKARRGIYRAYVPHDADHAAGISRRRRVR